MKILYVVIIPLIFISGYKSGQKIENFKNEIERKEEAILLNTISTLQSEISILKDSIAYCKSDRKRQDEIILKSESKGVLRRVLNI